MAEALKRVFADKKEEDEAAFVTFVTAGYPTADSTVPLMMALEAGGADIIELGMPFSDPIGDGPTIQKSNTVSFSPPLKPSPPRKATEALELIM